MNYVGNQEQFRGKQKHLFKKKKSTNVIERNPASPIGLSNFPHKDKCDIISDHLIKYDIQCLTV